MVEYVTHATLHLLEPSDTPILREDQMGPCVVHLRGNLAGRLPPAAGAAWAHWMGWEVPGIGRYLHTNTHTHTHMNTEGQIR